MITIEQVGVRHVDGGTVRHEAQTDRVPRRRPAVRDGRGPVRPVAVRVRGGAMCPSPVVPPRSAPHAHGVLRRVTAGIGLALVSAAAVVGLGLLADVAGASTASTPAGAPVPTVASP